MRSIRHDDRYRDVVRGMHRHGQWNMTTLRTNLESAAHKARDLLSREGRGDNPSNSRTDTIFFVLGTSLKPLQGRRGPPQK